MLHVKPETINTPVYLYASLTHSINSLSLSPHSKYLYQQSRDREVELPIRLENRIWQPVPVVRV